MGYFIRKININNWRNEFNKPLNEVCSAAINELADKENELSIWYARTKEDVDRLALVMYNIFSCKNKVSLIQIPEESIRKETLTVKSKPSSTIFNACDEWHYIIIDFDYEKIGKIANAFLCANKDCNGGGIIEYEIGEIKQLLDLYYKEIDESKCKLLK